MLHQRFKLYKRPGRPVAMITGTQPNQIISKSLGLQTLEPRGAKQSSDSERLFI